MEIVKYNGWDCIRLTNGKVEVLITRSVGPRIIRYGFIGGPNMLGEIESQKYTSGEDKWMNRGGHRLWIAPEADPWSYELDNEPYAEAYEIPGGVHTRQDPGCITGVQKEMDILLDDETGFVTIRHRLTNCRNESLKLSLWTVNVCGLNGREIIPLPAKAGHSSENLLPNQNWALWSYTDFTDPRWSFGSRFVFLRQDPSISEPQKFGLRNRFGWLGYERENMLFITKFKHIDGAEYPDNNCNCETFVNGEIIELEHLAPLVTLSPGESTEEIEEWKLFDGFTPCRDEADVLARVIPLV